MDLNFVLSNFGANAVFWCEQSPRTNLFIERAYLLARKKLRTSRKWESSNSLPCIVSPNTQFARNLLPIKSRRLQCQLGSIAIRTRAFSRARERSHKYWPWSDFRQMKGDLSTRWHPKPVAIVICWNVDGARVHARTCVRVAVDRSYIVETRSRDCVIRATSAESSITIRNTRNYATSEKVKSQGKCAVAAGQSTHSYPLPHPRRRCPQLLINVFLDGTALIEIRVSLSLSLSRED